MEEKPYSKRELDHYFKDLFGRMDNQDSALGKIFEQTSKTNGRVNRLEWWRGVVIWGIGALWAILVVLVPVIWSYIKIEIKADSIDAVTAALNQFNIQIK